MTRLYDVRKSTVVGYGKAVPGDGVFTNRKMTSNTLICSYGGKGRTVNTSDENCDVEYTLQIAPGQYVDAKGHFTSKLNHKWGAAANVMFEPGTGDLRTLRDIAANEELFVDYGPGYWANVFFPERGDFECLNYLQQSAMLYDCSVLLPNDLAHLSVYERTVHDAYYK